MKNALKALLFVSLLTACAAAPALGEEGAAPLPEGLAGFRGLLLGKLVSKGEAILVLNVETVLRVWNKSEAKNPEAAVGRDLAMVINTAPEWSKRLVETLKALKVGDRIEVGALQREDGALVVGEVLQPALDIPIDGRGFRGILVGTIKSKTDNSFVLKVEEIGRTWQQSKAENPKALVGLELTLAARPQAEQILHALKGLGAGDRIRAGALYLENAFFAVEVLEKTE